MTKPTGTADEILNLPAGGGSVSGSGTSFSVDLNTGALTASFDLTLPYGPNGIVPPISLSYSSTNGDGPFGLGWSIGTLAVLAKVTPTIGPPDPSAPGTYSMTGVGDLVDMGAGRWRPTVDATGQLIELANGSWTVTDNRDTSFTLGTTAASRIGSPPVAWLLDGSSDSSGHTISYTWTGDHGTLLPDTVSWGTYQLVFVYQDRPDLLLSGAYGSTVLTTQRCQSIELHVTTETPSLVRSWSLLYDDDGGLGRSFLSVIREQGHGADGTALAAPDRTFTYTAARPAQLSPVTGWMSPLDNPDTDLVDLNGDGLPDVLNLGSGRPTMSPNLGGGRFGFPQPLSQAPSALRLSSATVAFADMTGAGNADLLVLDQPFAGYFPLSAPGGAAPSGFGRPVTFDQAPHVLPGSPQVRLVDLNGDGLTDLLHDTGRAWLEYLRVADTSWSPYPIVLPVDRTPQVSLTDRHVYLADMTGDGRTDVVRVSGGGVTYWPARADGGWDQAVTMSPAPQVGRDWDPERLALFDVDGDGCADLVYVGPTSVQVWFNTGANRLSAPTTIDHTPLATVGSYRLVDLFGSGTAGVLFDLPPLGSTPVRQAFLDLTGGVKPGLLGEIANGPAFVTRVTWQPSTAFALSDAQSGAPWATYHPFPVQCVAQSDQTDHGSNVTTTVRYAYHDGRYDPATRLFLGFGRVDSDLLGDATCPTLRTETTFHLGLDPADPTRPLTADEAFALGALRRKVLSTTVWGLDGSALAAIPYSVTTSMYAALAVASSLGNGDEIAVPYTVSTTEQRWERQTAPLSTRVVAYGVVDEEGDMTTQRTTATRAGAAAPDQDVTTSITYATGGKNLRLPARVTQTAADGSVIGANVTYYDGDPFVGLPEGQATSGLATRIEDLVLTPTVVTAVWGANPPDFATYGYHRLPGDSDNWWVTRRATQRQTTASGPRISTRGPLGAAQTVQLDRAGQRAVAVSDAVGNTITATIDNRVWQTASVTDQNGNTVTDTFDPLGRVTATLQPADTPALPWASYEYAVGPVSTVTGSARIEHGQPATLPTINYLDGSGNRIGTAKPAATAGEWVISGATVRNAMGLVAQSWLPYQVTGDTWQPAPPGTGSVSITYDAMGRVVQKTRADGLIVATRRDGTDLVFSEQWPPGAATDMERQTFDAAGQLLSVSRNSGSHWVTQTYEYSSSGRATVVNLPNSLQALFYYDLLGRRIGHRSPDTGLTTYLLDACGNERLRTIATGQQVHTEVDAMNRVTGVYHDAEASPRVSYSYYDQGAAAPTDGLTANRAGRVWRVTDELGTVTLQYEEAGQVSTYTRQVAATGDEYTETYSFDALGRTTSVTLPPTTAGGAGRTVDYTFGPDGRLQAASGVVTGATYDVMGRPTALDYANGCHTLIDYRPNGGAVGRVRVTDGTGTTIRDLTLTASDSLVDGLASATAGDDSVAFTYDGLRRLASAAYTGGTGALDDHSWSYGDDFTVSTCSDAGALTYTPGTHQLSSIAGTAVGFDTAGRMSSGRFGQMAFDSADHLSQITSPGGQVTSHVYGYKGSRVSTVAAGAQTYLAPTDNFVIRDGQPVAWISFGPIQVAAEISGALWFLHAHALGGTDLITDASGVEAGRVRLTPYGLARSGAGSAPSGGAAVLAVLLSGADTTGLVCLGQRWYDPLVGQFVSPDLVVNGIYTVGVWNPYLYCLGNPVSLFDPAGADFWSVLEIIGIAILAAACVVAAIWTGGASLVALGVLTANLSTGMLVGVAIGALGGAIAGELAAQKAGGNIWAGAFMGAFIGGVTSLAGGVLGGIVGGALKALPLLQYVVSGAVQGAIAGFGSGLAVGYAGGKGNAEQMFLHTATGALWGASLGALLGLGTYFVCASPPPVSPGQQPATSPYLQIGSINQLNPGAAQTTAGVVASVNNDLTLGNDIAQVASNVSGSNTGGLLADFVGTRYLADDASIFFSNGALLNIPIGWVPSAVLNNGAFAALVNVSFAADQAGFSFADQLTKILKMTPVGWLMTVFVEWNPDNDYNTVANGFNQALGSADPNEFS